MAEQVFENHRIPLRAVYQRHALDSGTVFRAEDCREQKLGSQRRDGQMETNFSPKIVTRNKC